MRKVVKAKAADFNKFFDFFKKTLHEEYFLYAKTNANYLLKRSLPKKSQLKKDVLVGRRPLYLVYQQSNIVGYLLAEENFGGVAFGHWLAVDKAFRNQDLASELLKVWKKDSLKQGAHVLQLWTTENDPGFYGKKGFTLGGKFAKAWLGIDHYLFYKIIADPAPQKYI